MELSAGLDVKSRHVARFEIRVDAAAPASPPEAELCAILPTTAAPRQARERALTPLAHSAEQFLARQRLDALLEP